MQACDQAKQNLNEAVEPVLTKYRGFLTHLRPGQNRDIYPWNTPEDVVMEVARRLREDGWIVDRKQYRGNKANYSGGDYFIRVTAPCCCKS